MDEYCDHIEELQVFLAEREVDIALSSIRGKVKPPLNPDRKKRLVKHVSVCDPCSNTYAAHVRGPAYREIDKQSSNPHFRAGEFQASFHAEVRIRDDLELLSPSRASKTDYESEVLRYASSEAIVRNRCRIKAFGERFDASKPKNGIELRRLIEDFDSHFS